MVQLPSTDPSDIANTARCFSCNITGLNDLAVRTYLLTQVGNIATPPCITPTAPSFLAIFGGQVTDTTIRINWKQVGNSGSLITGYTVKWGTVSGVYTNSSANLPVSPRNYIITGLTAGTNYFIVVVANTNLGCSSANSAEFTQATTMSGCSAASQLFVTDWANRVTANGGAAPSGSTKTALCTFKDGLVTDGIDALMLSWNAIVPDNLIAALTPQLVGGGNNPWINHNFLAGDITVNGLIGDGATKFLDTGLIPNVTFPSDANGGITVYLFTNGADAPGCFIGSTQNDACVHAIDLQKAAGAMFLDLYGCNTGRITANDAAFLGYISGNRTGAGSEAIYEASSTVAHHTLVSGAGAGDSRPNLSMFAYAFNITGAAGTFATPRMSFIAAHQGLTSAQSALFFARIDALRIALGGGRV